MNWSQVDWTGVAAVLGPVLVGVTWLASRRERRTESNSNAMTATAEAAVDTVAMMQSLLHPMQDEISELRKEIVSLRLHVTLLETQIRELGSDPLPPPVPPENGV